MMQINLMPDYEALTARINLIVHLGKLDVFRRLGINGSNTTDITWGDDDVITYGSDA